MVVFTGHDTKIMQNSKKTDFRFSETDVKINHIIIAFFALQVVLSLFLAIWSSFWEMKNDGIWGHIVGESVGQVS